MGAVADQYADYAIITSDNPRKEDPEAIVRDIEAGFKHKNYEKVVDRKKAIARAIAQQHRGSVTCEDCDTGASFTLELPAA